MKWFVLLLIAIVASVLAVFEPRHWQITSATPKTVMLPGFPQHHYLFIHDDEYDTEPV
jgi:hypothetical protein